MKIFVCALCALVAVCIAVTLSGIYISRSVCELDECLTQLPEGLTKTEEFDDVLRRIDDATERFNSKSTVLSSFIGHRELDETDTLLVTLSSAVRAKDDAYYRTTLAALREKLEKLALSERFTLLGIL